MKKHRIRLINQFSSSDCGLACILMIFKSYGYDKNLYDLIATVRPSRDGLTVAQLKNISKDNQFDLKAFKFNSKKSLVQNLPAILPTKDGHYVVVSSVKNDVFTVLDPAEGVQKQSFQILQQNCLPVLCVITPLPSFSKQTKFHGFIPSNKGILGSFNFKKSDVFITIFCTVILEAIVLIIPDIIKRIVNASVKTDINIQQVLIVLCLIIIGFFSLNLLFTWIRQWIVLRMQTSVFKQVIDKLFKKLFSIDLTFYETHSTGDILNRFNNISMINNFLSTFLIKMFIDILTGIVCFIVMLTISPLLTTSIVLIGAFEGGLIYSLNSKLHSKTQEYITTQTQAQDNMADVFNNIIQIMCMGSQDKLEKDLENKYFKSIDSFREKGSVNNTLQSWLDSISVITNLLIYTLGFFLIQKGQINIGTLIQFVSLSSFAITPINTTIGAIPQIKVIQEIINRLNEIMFYKSVSRNGGTEISAINDIEVSHVSFSYSQTTNLDLRDISIKIPKGKRIAIVGNSGGGKTTLTKLIMNVFDDYNGNMYVNDVNYRKLNSASLYDKISVVTQTPLAINGTIKDNLDFGNNLTDSQIENCLKNAEILDFVRQLPLGINTIMGDNGQNLSGGQKQRIAIARAISKNPELIIFDEGTNSLDQLTEQKIYHNLQSLNITQLIISHRLAAIQDADYIYVLSHGAIIEEGVHDELMAKKGLYYRNFLDNKQIEGGES